VTSINTPLSDSSGRIPLQSIPDLSATYVGLNKVGQSKFETQRSLALEPWHAALANRDNAPAKWLALGDSITEGMGASTNLNRWTQRSLTGLRNRFATTGLTGGGTGFLPSHYDSTSMGQPYSASSGTPVLNTDFGIGRRTAQMTGTQTYTYTITCSSFDVWYVTPTTTGTIGVQIDGGAVISVNTVGGTILDGNVWNSGALTPGTHTVVISVVAGTTYFGGISVYNGDESKGIRLYEAGHYGWTTSNWLTNSNWWPRTINTIQPHLVTIALGTNDINAGVNPKTFGTNLNSLITSIRGQITAPPSIVLVAYPARTDITPAYPWQSYVDQMHSIASADSLISVLDLSVRMSSPSNTAIGTWNADKVHPVDKGHALIADTFTGFISPK